MREQSGKYGQEYHSAGSVPRFLIAAPSSGSGKTVITCGILKLLLRRGLIPAAFKCGPDYIDPLFHREALGVESGNLDGFFQTGQQMEESFLLGCREAGQKGGQETADIAVIEGVMGYFDGLGGTSSRASSWETARRLACPTIFVVDGRGASLSVGALVQGFLQFEPEPGELGEENQIRGILLNRVSAGMYPVLKRMLEDRFSVPVVGYVPKLDWLRIESRHLGLMLPGEIRNLEKQLERFAEVLEETLDVELLLKLAGYRETEQRGGGRTALCRGKTEWGTETRLIYRQSRKVTIGVARDEAFCFYYRDNLAALEKAGAVLLEFSPLHLETLPEGLDGLLFGGGYPEVYAGALSRNESMCRAVRQAALNGMPVLAECGGFLYLLEALEDEEGRAWPMAGVLSGKGIRTGRLGRFGYVTLEALSDSCYLNKGEKIRAHEFHYWDSTCCGEEMKAVKPTGSRSWSCMRQEKRVLAGFPHLYYPSFPELPGRFVRQCVQYQQEQLQNREWRKF